MYTESPVQSVHHSRATPSMGSPEMPRKLKSNDDMDASWSRSTERHRVTKLSQIKCRHRADHNKRTKEGHRLRGREEGSEDEGTKDQKVRRSEDQSTEDQRPEDQRSENHNTCKPQERVDSTKKARERERERERRTENIRTQLKNSNKCNNQIQCEHKPSEHVLLHEPSN